jgi:hypothetical protein
VIKTVYENHDECLTAILEICGLSNFTLDPTYSTGNFYKGEVPEPTLKSDVRPQTEDVIEMDCRELVYKTGTIRSIIFDPPFLATRGPSLRGSSGNEIARRFTVFNDEKTLHSFYSDALMEFYRVLAPGGFLVFKCQDKVSSGKQYFSHVYIHNWAISIGFYPKDLFIYVHKTRMVADWQRTQQHARKYHSYFWVFQKIRPKVDWHELTNGGVK